MEYVILIGYFVPILVAVLRKHRGVNSIILVNIVLGWTGIMWFACLVWAFNSNVQGTGGGVKVEK